MKFVMCENSLSKWEFQTKFPYQKFQSLQIFVKVMKFVVSETLKHQNENLKQNFLIKRKKLQKFPIYQSYEICHVKTENFQLCVHKSIQSKMENFRFFFAEVPIRIHSYESDLLWSTPEEIKIGRICIKDKYSSIHMKTLKPLLSKQDEESARIKYVVCYHIQNPVFKTLRYPDTSSRQSYTRNRGQRTGVWNTMMFEIKFYFRS